MYQRIFVPIDGSPTSNRGLGEAIALAKLTGGQLHLIHVLDEISFADAYAMMYSSEISAALRAGGQDILDAGREQVEAAGVPVDVVLREALADRVCDVIIEEATRWSAELIVIGTHGRRGLGRVLLGSDAEQILRLAPVPVLLVRAQ